MTETDEIVERSSAGLMRATWLFVAIGCVLGGLIVAGSGTTLPYLPFLAWPVSVVGLSLALGAAYRYRRRRSALVWAGVVASGVVALGQTLLIPMVWQATSDYAKTSVAESNLRGLGIAVEQYCSQHAEYPSSLQSLVDAGFCTPKQLVSPRDPDLGDLDLRGDALAYSSFVYHPGRGAWRDEPDVILARERQAWSPLELSLFPKRGCCTLFGDGNVRILEATALDAAVRRDADRRSALGWPAWEWSM